jgi:hypothetical protein
MNFGEALKNAKSIASSLRGRDMSDMTTESVKNALHKGVVAVDFTKTNGEVRQMRCTLRSDMIPAAPVIEGKTPKKENPDVQAVWDLDKGAWRSFRFDSLISVSLETT